MFTDAFAAVPYVEVADEESPTNFATPPTASAAAKPGFAPTSSMWQNVTSPASSTIASTTLPPRPLSPSLNAGLISSYFLSRQQRPPTSQPQIWHPPQQMSHLSHQQNQQHHCQQTQQQQTQSQSHSYFSSLNTSLPKK